MDKAYSAINHTLVRLFNHIMRIEEQALAQEKLSIREVHVIEAICDATEENLNTMTDVAARLHVTPGTLSVSVRTLSAKGYLERVPDSRDKRVTRVIPTQKALEVNTRHQAFHHEMTDAIIGKVTPEELNALVNALQNADAYFTAKENEQ